MGILIDTVSVRFGDTYILRDFSLSLPDKGIVSIFGASGCGKTTLLHMLAGLIQPESGAITGLEEKRVSVVFQQPRLLPWVNAAENVAAVMPAGEHAERAVELLISLGLSEEDARKLPYELSGGMQQRAAIARALAAPYDVLLLDEPFTALDGVNVKAAAKLLYAGAKQDKLIVLVTHNAEQAAAADTAVLVGGPPLVCREVLNISACNPEEGAKLIKQSI